MSSPALEGNVSNLLSIGGVLVTSLVLTQGVTDPVNAPKFLALGLLAGACLGLLLLGYKDFKGIRIIEVIVYIFCLWSAFAMFVSDSPFTQNFYGTYGRNTGWLSYLFLSIVMLTATRLRTKVGISRILKGFLFVLFLNLVYGFWVMCFGDFVGWNNNYDALLGTFGNPNFVSSFFGIGFVVICALIMRTGTKFRILGFTALVFLIFELRQCDSIQGFAVLVFGLWIMGIYYLHIRFRNEILTAFYTGAGILIGVLSSLGAIGLGPLGESFKQRTLMLRLEYWRAGWNMAVGHPIFGVGMDAFGDWYRRARNPQALISPGPNTVTNVAHNVFIDLLASGGFPLAFLYFLIVSVVSIIAIRLVLKSESFDPILAGIAAIWFCYQIQSLISINQLGLAIWGWLAGGLIVAYGKLELTNDKKSKLSGKQNSSASVISPGLAMFVFGAIGFLVSAPPLIADLEWRKFQTTGNLVQLGKALENSYFAPINSQQIATAVQILDNGNVPELAIKYARIATQFNPDSIDAWRSLYFVKDATNEERVKARREMIRLDPLNPEWRNLV